MRRIGVGAKKTESELTLLANRIEELEKENKQLKAENKKLKKELKAEEEIAEA